MKVLKDFSYEKACCDKMEHELQKGDMYSFDSIYGVFVYSPRKNNQWVSFDKCPFCGEEITDANFL